MTAFSYNTVAFIMTDAYRSGNCASICIVYYKFMNITENSFTGTSCCQTRMHESFWMLDISLDSHLNHCNIYTEKFMYDCWCCFLVAPKYWRVAETTHRFIRCWIYLSIKSSVQCIRYFLKEEGWLLMDVHRLPGTQ